MGGGESSARSCCRARMTSDLALISEALKKTKRKKTAVALRERAAGLAAVRAAAPGCALLHRRNSLGSGFGDTLETQSRALDHDGCSCCGGGEASQATAAATAGLLRLGCRAPFVRTSLETTNEALRQRWPSHGTPGRMEKKQRMSETCIHIKKHNVGNIIESKCSPSMPKTTTTVETQPLPSRSNTPLFFLLGLVISP